MSMPNGDLGTSFHVFGSGHPADHFASLNEKNKTRSMYKLQFVNLGHHVRCFGGGAGAIWYSNSVEVLNAIETFGLLRTFYLFRTRK
jgi:hypothetical protein